MSIPPLKFHFNTKVKVNQGGFYNGATGTVIDKRWEAHMQYLVRLYSPSTVTKDVWFNESDLEAEYGI